MEYMPAKEVAEKWGVTRRRVQVYSIEERITGAKKVGSQWIIPKEAKKPEDPRKKEST